MMLLAAVVLILAFLALSAMVARVSQLGSVTGQDQGRPILMEIDQVQGAIQDIIANLDAIGFTDEVAYQSELEAVLEHLAFLERGHGFRLQVTALTTVAAPPDPNPCSATDTYYQVEVTYEVSDGDLLVSLVETGHYCKPPPPPPPPPPP